MAKPGVNMKLNVNFDNKVFNILDQNDVDKLMKKIEPYDDATKQQIVQNILEYADQAFAKITDDWYKIQIISFLYKKIYNFDVRC